MISSAGPADMIATAWYRLGYKPRNSLIVLGLEGPRQRVGVLLRADLPTSGSHDPSGGGPRPIDRLPPEVLPTMLPELVADLLTTVAASNACGVMAIVADERALDRRPPPVVRALRHGVREFGLRLTDVLGVTSSAFGSLLCRDPRCCPPGGRPIAQVLSSRSAAVYVVNGSTVAESEFDLLRDVTPDPADQLDENRAAVTDSPALDRWCWWRRWSEAVALAEAEPNRVEPLRGLSAALHDCRLRDAVLVGVLGAEEDEVRAVLDGNHEWPVQSGVEGVKDLGRLLRRCPDDQRLRVGQTVLAGAVRVARDGDRGPGLAALAMLAWLMGEGGRSRLLLERAWADAPSVSLLSLVQDLLDRRVPPPMG